MVLGFCIRGARSGIEGLVSPVDVGRALVVENGRDGSLGRNAAGRMYRNGLVERMSGRRLRKSGAAQVPTSIDGIQVEGCHDRIGLDSTAGKPDRFQSAPNFDHSSKDQSLSHSAGTDS